LKIDINNRRVYFQTENKIYFVNGLSKTDDLPDYSDIIEKTHPELLSNSLFEITLSKNEIDSYLLSWNRLFKTCPKDQDMTGNDGISFIISNTKQSCVIRSPEMHREVIYDFLEKIKKTFTPNTIVDRYIFENKMYFENDKSFEVLNLSPLYLKIYQFPLLGCSSFKEQIEALPNKKEIYIDITDFKKSDEKECLIEVLNKKFSKITVVQNKQIDYFNE